MKKRFFTTTISLLILAILFNTTLPLFDIKVNAYSDSSKAVEEELKAIISKYGENNIVFEDGVSIYLGQEFDLSKYSQYQDIVWNSENEEILEVNNNILIGKEEGTTFAVGHKSDKYYIKEVYVYSNNQRSIMNANSYETKSNSQYVVYLDPGHGGTDPGASGNGIVEKNMVLDMSLRLKSKLEANGIKVIMSRTTDEYVSLQDRSNRANSANPNLFISIHINAATATSASGIETFYYKNIDKSLAQSLQDNLINSTGAINRGVKWEEFYVVKNTNMPASLVELGFLSNVNEANKLKDNNYQEKLINSMLNGTLNYIYSNNPIVATRIYGNDRYETSYKLFEAGWKSSENAILASGLDYPDALSATPLATKYGAPILLAKNTSLNNQQTLLNLLKSKGVKNVFIVGGTGVMPGSFEGELSNIGISSTRLGGANRYETSVKIAQQVGSNTGEVAIASGLDFADGLSISSIAAIKNMPILLTDKNEVSDVTLNYINSNNITKSYVIGSTGAISNNVANRLPNVERLGGANRYETNKIIFNRFSSELKLSNLYIASGLDFPDALSVSALAGRQTSFVVLSNLKGVESSAKEVVTSARPYLDNIYVLGGNGVIVDNVLYNLGINIIR